MDALDTLCGVGVSKIKIYIAARPETLARTRLRNASMLPMHMVTWDGIKRDLADKIAHVVSLHDTRKLFINAILRKVGGVFLYAALAAVDLLDGLAHAKSTVELLNMLDQLPGDIETYLKSKLPEEREPLAQWIHLLMEYVNAP